MKIDTIDDFSSARETSSGERQRTGRIGAGLAGAMLILAAAACDSEPAGPADAGAGLQFHDGARAYSAQGSPTASGSVLGREFAVARADSVGGFALIGYAPTGDDVGDLFVLQAPRATGVHECTLHFGPCHGRYILGVRNGSTASAERFFHAVAGTLTINEMGPARVRGTFSLTLEADDGLPDDTITIENGTIDVPYSAEEVTDGALACLLSLVGAGPGSCRA